MIIVLIPSSPNREFPKASLFETAKLMFKPEIAPAAQAQSEWVPHALCLTVSKQQR